MNRFAWDLRYDDPVQTPGAFYVGEPPAGPVVPPGDYQVKLTVNGQSQTAPLHVVIDPREKDAAEGIAASRRARAAGARSHLAAALRPSTKSARPKAQIDALTKRFADNEKVKPALAAAADLEKKADEIEGALMQVKMKSSEGNLVYPERAERRILQLQRHDRRRRRADRAATGSLPETQRPARRAAKNWADLKASEVPKVNEMIKQADVPALTVAR